MAGGATVVSLTRDSFPKYRAMPAVAVLCEPYPSLIGPSKFIHHLSEQLSS